MLQEFQIVRHSTAPPISIKCPIAAVAGMAIMRDTSDSAVDLPQAALATGAAIGFLKRAVADPGPTTIELADVWPGHAELPDRKGGQVTLDPLPEAYEAEGETYLLLSGTGALSSGTALNSHISFVNGKSRVAQTGDVAQYKLSAKMTSVVNAGALRCLFERI